MACLSNSIPIWCVSPLFFWQVVKHEDEIIKKNKIKKIKVSFGRCWHLIVGWLFKCSFAWASEYLWLMAVFNSHPFINATGARRPTKQVLKGGGGGGGVILNNKFWIIMIMAATWTAENNISIVGELLIH